MKKSILCILGALILSAPVMAQSAATKAAIDNIMTRSSIRKFKQQPVEDGKIDTLLHAGMAGPTSHDKQPWHFVVIKDAAAREKYAATNKFHGDQIRQTPLIIIVCGDTTRMQAGEDRAYWIADCSAASENILLAAHALGLGAVWTSVFPETRKMQAFQRNLNLPGNLIPLNSIMIGYPDQPTNIKDKWDPGKITWWK